MADPNELRPGIYADLITVALANHLDQFEPQFVDIESLDPADSHVVLSRHVMHQLSRALQSVGHRDDDPRMAQVSLVNDLLSLITERVPALPLSREQVAPPARALHAIRNPVPPPQQPTSPVRPTIPLTESALLVNGRGQPRIGNELKLELRSALSVDLICAFLTWYGYRIIQEDLKSVIERGGRVRVLTTTFTGTTEKAVLDDLVRIGAEVRVSYDVANTRLHAKAWLFRRSTVSTAYVGSSNLTKTALFEGLEWNVRLTATSQPHLLDSIGAAFDDFWLDGSFEPYDPARDGQRFEEARAQQTGSRAVDETLIAPIEVTARPYQREVLDRLTAERELHGRRHNLVVMATGTGKTVVSALDYRRLRDQGKVESVLFVAHRREILEQSLRTFRQVVRDGTFGESFMGGLRPKMWSHVFASIQSLAELDLEALPADRFDMIVVDEFHHAEAKTYERLLDHVRPKYLLGLTATPERADGKDITRWFDGRIAVELRLWQALDRALLAPFQYFGISDATDLSHVRWVRGAYDQAELSRLYSEDHGRAAIIAKALSDKVSDVRSMRALGFCVSIAHATFMADEMRRGGIPSIAVSAQSTPEERAAALDALRRREVNIIFSVDLFNEGLDIPNIDTVLLLRPTESATIYLQQIGRGLRLADDKPCLTVLDFIGAQNKAFRFDLRFAALTGSRPSKVAEQVRDGFPMLPPGCHIQLDRVSRETVLTNLRTVLGTTWRRMVEELRSGPQPSMSAFLQASDFTLEDIYRTKGRSWMSLLRDAHLTDDSSPVKVDLSGGIRRLLHVDDAARIEAIRRLAAGQMDFSRLTDLERRVALMIYFSLQGSGAQARNLEVELKTLPASGWSEELLELADALEERRDRPTFPLSSSVPLEAHASYTRDEALAAFGFDRPDTVREGTKWLPNANADVFFVTINKSEAHYSPTTMYRDRALSPKLFQWESQSTTSVDSPTAERYFNHDQRGSSVHLFLRIDRENTIGLSAPYLYAGPIHHVRQAGSRPVEVIWELERDLPADVFHDARVLSA